MDDIKNLLYALGFGLNKEEDVETVVITATKLTTSIVEPVLVVLVAVMS